jgi:hypothetical protein
LNFNGTHQIVVYADDVNIMGGSVHPIKEKAETLVVVSKEIGLEINADKISICSCLEIECTTTS